MMHIFNITEVHATSRGIIDVGSVTIYMDNQEFMFDTKEEIINGNHNFKVFLSFGTDNEILKLNVNNETHQVMDEQFVNFIYEHYQEQTQM
jgi:hypothetical protein